MRLVQADAADSQQLLATEPAIIYNIAVVQLHLMAAVER